MGYRITPMLRVVAELGVPDLLAGGPRSAAQLASSCGAHADSLYRILRALSSFGVFEESDGRVFRLTPMADLLRSDVPGSFRNAARTLATESSWRPYASLLESAKSGKTSFDLVYGEGRFEWLGKHEAEARLFDAFQAEITRRSSAAVLAAYDFSSFGHVVDVGGGAGELLWAVLARSPRVQGTLFDLPHVVDSAQKAAAPSLRDRCRFVGGDFFQSVPEGGDVFILKYILHDWSDERSRAILGNCRRAMRVGGRLLIIEELVCGPNQPCRAKLGDIGMMAMTGGRNRTEVEYRDLAVAGGFRVARVLAAGPFHILEAVL